MEFGVFCLSSLLPLFSAGITSADSGSRFRSQHFGQALHTRRVIDFLLFRLHHGFAFFGRASFAGGNNHGMGYWMGRFGEWRHWDLGWLALPE
jgi:hypothetical protein